MNKILYTIILIFFTLILSAQQKINIDEMTKEDVLELSYDDLLEMPFEDLLKLADIVGVSLDELYEMLLNKDVKSASKKVESSFEAPLSTSVISSEEIIQSGARTIEEALRLAPGMIVREKTNGNFDVHIRGNDNVPPGNMLLYSENSISLVMIDGRVIYNYAHGGTFWESVPVDIVDVDRIEIVRGPSSALYGPNAASGVIHIITKKHEGDKLKANVIAQSDITNSNLYSANISKGIKKLKIGVSGNYQRFTRFQEDFYIWKQAPGTYVHRDSLATMSVPGAGTVYEKKDVDKRFPEPDLGRDKYGVNGYLNYNINDDSYLNLSSGIQSSNDITTALDNPYYPLTRRVISSQYADFKFKLNGLHTQFSYTGGDAEIAVEKPEFHVDYITIDGIMEYELRLENLTLRPGISYRTSTYDDSKYINEDIKEGFLNGPRSITNFSYSLRADYIAFERLRLIGALRGDKYNYPDKTYLTYQLIGSYMFNDKNMLRIVHSRANRSPFVIDVYANYEWNRIPPNPVLPQGGYFYFEGNKALDLMQMDMFEIGYRAKPTKKVQIDLEGFYSKAKNFDSFVLDSIQMREVVGLQTLPNYALFNYQNLDVEAIQKGVTVTINYVINKDLYLKLFGTYQVTDLKDHDEQTIETALNTMGTSAVLIGDVYYNNADTTVYALGATDKILVDIKHKSTPEFYGGMFINWAPIKKLNVNANIYGYSKQELIHSFETTKIDAGFNLNLRVAYKFWKENTVFINGRNLLSNGKKEFAFVDDINRTILMGINLTY